MAQSMVKQWRQIVDAQKPCLRLEKSLLVAAINNTFVLYLGFGEGRNYRVASLGGWVGSQGSSRRRK
ncbi:hypothetical protein L484_013370 [Morus notabilis]|uniref:TFIIS N-terminal domain-containing protein n=1 Tax=Morus notabilis TaxID=981085 RepID=W9QZ79_9ROSA|nr:hypothetical protein L484_013370 [Morus notabilis]